MEVSGILGGSLSSIRRDKMGVDVREREGNEGKAGKMNGKKMVLFVLLTGRKNSREKDIEIEGEIRKLYFEYLVR